jgi:DNA-binding protein
MITVGVKREANFAIARIEAVHRDKIGKATVRALNRAIDTAQTIANRKIRERYNVKAAVVRKAMKKKRAHLGQAYAVAELEITGYRIPLMAFGASWTRKMQPGASFRVLKGGGRKSVRGAFIATMKSGHRGVFRRSGKFGRNKNPKLEKIAEMYSVSLPQQFRNRVVQVAVRLATREAFSKNFAQQLKYLSGT